MPKSLPIPDPGPGHLLAALVASIFCSFIILYLDKALIWTPVVALISMLSTCYIIYYWRLFTPRSTLVIWLPCVLLVTSTYLGESSAQRRHTPVRPEPPTKEALPVAYTELQDVFTGFDTTTPDQDLVILSIEGLTVEPTRIAFGYSRTENLVRIQGQGMVYPLSSTISLDDGSRFKYHRDLINRISLESLDHPGFILRRQK